MIAPDRSRRGAAEATRSRLLEAGRRAFARKGLSGTNLKEDVLRPAEVSVGSFYHQFKDKTELLLAILREHADAYRERLHLVHTPSVGRSLADIARDSYATVFDLADESIDVMRIQMRERDSDDPRVREFLRADRDRWIDSLASDYARLGGNFDTKLAATLMVGLSLSAVAHYHEIPPAERPAARDRLLDALARFTLGGLPALPECDGPPESAPR